MIQLETVQLFLMQFKALKQSNGILFYDRRKNLQALLDLEMHASERERIIDGLVAEDYYKGPFPDKVKKGAEYWEFGKYIKHKEIYIKISLGFQKGKVWCLSFHQAERPIKYPLGTRKE